MGPVRMSRGSLQIQVLQPLIGTLSSFQKALMTLTGPYQDLGDPSKLSEGVTTYQALRGSILPELRILAGFRGL